MRSCLITGMKISPYKHSQVCWPVCWDESSKMQLQAIFNNCQNYKIVLASMVEFSHINTRQICLAHLTKQLAISGLTMSFSHISRQARTMKLAKSRNKLTRKHQVLHLMGKNTSSASSVAVSTQP